MVLYISLNLLEINVYGTTSIVKKQRITIYKN